MSVQIFIDFFQSLTMVGIFVFLLLQCKYSNVKFDQLNERTQKTYSISVFTFLISGTAAFIGWLWT